MIGPQVKPTTGICALTILWSEILPNPLPNYNVYVHFILLHWRHMQPFESIFGSVLPALDYQPVTGILHCVL